jgi:peptide/nickel transport system permease protein
VATITPTSWRQALALVWLSALVVVALLAPYLPLPYQPAVPDLAEIAVPPLGANSQHWLGTDSQGQDVLANLVFGARTVVFLTLPAAVAASLLGALLGSMAGFWGNAYRLPVPYWLLMLGLGWWCAAFPYPGYGLSVACAALVWLFVSRMLPARPLPACPLPADAFVLGSVALLGAVPRLILVVAIAGTGVEPVGLMALLSFTAWPDMARLVRAQMLRVRVLPFVEAAQAAGLSPNRVWWRHALPHALQPLRTALPLSIAALIGLENTLSFLGVGLPPTVPSWGRLLSSARLAPEAWWLSVFPIIAITISILSLQSLTSTHQNKHSRQIS